MFPRRGALAGVLTIALLVFLLSYKTPTVASPADFMADGGPTDSPTLPAFVIGADPSGADMVAMASADVPATGGTNTAESTAATPDSTAITTGPTPTTTGSTAGGTPASGGTPVAGGTPAAGGTPTSGGTSGGVASGGAPVSGSTPVAVATPAPTHAPAAGTTPSPTRAPAPTLAPTPAPTPRPPTPAPAGYTGAIAGTVITTKYGPMQVKVVWSGGKITDVVTLQSTNRDGESKSISGSACPILRSEALKAQSASIATVSGATYTSNGYKQSMQSALNQKP